MNKFFFLAVCALPALLSGCSENELASMETLGQNAIGFHLVGSQAETKATPISSSNLTTTDFDVFAFTPAGEIFMGNNSESFAHDGVQIKYKDGKWDYANASELRYWPESTALDFYAVNPATVAENMLTNYAWNIHADKQEIWYTCADEFGSAGAHANYDVMYAIAKDQTKNTNAGKVKLQFHHILSQVVFKAKTQYAGMSVTVKDIKIHNFKMGGTFTFPADATTAPAQTNWALSPANGTFTAVKDKAIVVDSETTPTDISVATPMLFVPQKLTAWTITKTAPKTKLQADSDKESYLEICCKIQQNGVYLFGDASTYKTLYVPFGTSWEPGKRHIYTLIFGGGYDDHGKAILMPIEFEADVDEWADVDNNIAV